MYTELRHQMISVGKKLEHYGLVALSGGNLSVRAPDGNIIVTPSGKDYGNLLPEDLVVLDSTGKILEGKKRPSVDTVALLYVFNKLPHVNAIIHTHQIYATAIGLVEERMPAITTFLVNAVMGDVAVAPYSSAASMEMGIQAVNHLNNRRAVILKNHGVLTVGRTLKEALYAAVYLEDAAKCYFCSRMFGSPVELNDEQVEEAVKVFEDYGQPSER